MVRILDGFLKGICRIECGCTEFFDCEGVLDHRMQFESNMETVT